MDELNNWGQHRATESETKQLAETLVNESLDAIRPRLFACVSELLESPIGPKALFQFETVLLILLRELGRLIMQATLQSLEPAPAMLPADIYLQCGGYRRRSKPTANRHIATRFGTITLWRIGYRSWQRGEETVFPLELMLGLVEGTTPAMLDLMGRTTAAAGMSQQATLEAIGQRCGVSMGIKRLRACVEALAGRLEPLRQTHQVDRLLELLLEATKSSGNRKPVLCLGRDGITLRHRAGFFEVATAATVSVYDRAGKRLATVYLAHPPELGQATMDGMITSLLNDLLMRWQGPLPRLAYVTDSGSNETDYFRRVLRKMIHPLTNRRLDWTRVADFYHVSERVWAMAEALFTRKEKRESVAWARRMLKNLKRPSGASRVLHSAASLLSRRTLGESRLEDFHKAYRYIQSRTTYLKYHDYRRQHIPIGSGVTEAACKTVFTQRLKLSGQRWSHDGAKRILTLRTILLSGTWESTYGASLSMNVIPIRTYERNQNYAAKTAA